MVEFVAILYVAAFAALFRDAVLVKANLVKDGTAANFLPSVAWAIFMVVPFALQYRTFTPDAVWTQALGVFLVGGALLVGDWFASHFSVRTLPQYGSRGLLLGIGALLVALPAVHLALMPEIPLITKILHPDMTSGDLAQLRESASKLLKVPAPFIYFCQFCVLVAPAFAVSAWRQSKPLAVFVAAFFLFYSRATLAKGPLLFSLCLYALFAFYAFGEKTRRRLAMAAIVVAVPVFVGVAVYLWTAPLSILHCEKAARDFGLIPPALDAEIQGRNPRLPSMSTMDYCRLVGNMPDYEERISYTAKSINSALYRACFVPSEVASRWYAYYPRVHGDFLGLYGLTRDTRGQPGFQHPANSVGRWAYLTRFPKNYGETVSAYSSADADAYARFGVAGLVGLAVLLLLLRGPLPLLVTSSPFSQRLYWSAVVILALGLPSASLQALLVANGLAAIVVLSVILRFWQNRLRSNSLAY